METSVEIRPAEERDIDSIIRIFHEVYKEDYPYTHFFDPNWLRQSIYTDNMVMLGACDCGSGEVLGTASVVYGAGIHSDLQAEFGRLAVSCKARGRGIGNLLMEKRLEIVEERIHIGIVENRCPHDYSQKISTKYQFSPVGFLPYKHQFKNRESIALFAQVFNEALALRKNNPRLIPLVYTLAQMSFQNCGLPFDGVLDELSEVYPLRSNYHIEEFTSKDVTPLLRITRGRVVGKEVFGPTQLSYGFFRLKAKSANYLVAKSKAGENLIDAVAGAIGYIKDDLEKSLRIFELLTVDENSIQFLFSELLTKCQNEWGVKYIEIEVSAHAPKLQRTLSRLGFLPTAYIPAMVFDRVERLDVVKMVKLNMPFDLNGVELYPKEMDDMAKWVSNNFKEQSILPEIEIQLQKNPLFAEMSDDQRKILAAGLEKQTPDQNGVLYQQGGAPKGLFLILEGLGVVIQNGQRIGTVSAGEVIGERSLLSNTEHSVTIKFDEGAVIFGLTPKKLMSLEKKFPDIAMILYKNIVMDLGKRIQRLRGEGPSLSIEKAIS